MKRDVRVVDGKVIVKAKADDAIAKLSRLKLRTRIVEGGRLTDEERDLLLLALAQERGLL